MILGIETSCDETAAAIVTSDFKVLSNIIASQVEVHSRFGGVVPEIASRIHVLEIMPTISRALNAAGITGQDLEAIAVTKGPGLVGSLLVGISASKSLALAWQKPLIPINHLEGHLASVFLGEDHPEYPCLALLVSGGHTLLAKIESPGRNFLLGSTRDDSVGEAYDKISRLLGLGYPGGPVLDRISIQGSDILKFPRPMISEGFEFSFSGLKTSVASYVRNNSHYSIPDVAASFVGAVMDVLVAKIILAIRREHYKSIVVVGGVAASPVLRGRLRQIAAEQDLKICLPPSALSTDNGAMIAAAAWLLDRHGLGENLVFSAEPGLGLVAS